MYCSHMRQEGKKRTTFDVAHLSQKVLCVISGFHQHYKSQKKISTEKMITISMCYVFSHRAWHSNLGPGTLKTHVRIQTLYSLYTHAYSCSTADLLHWSSYFGLRLLVQDQCALSSTCTNHMVALDTFEMEPEKVVFP